MNVHSTRNRLLATTMICGAALSFGTTAFAQDSATIQPTAAPQEVVVTGSRIRSANLTSDSPLVSVGSAELKLEGTTTIDTLLNSLPQVTGGQNLGQSIDSNGTATVSLRNLGANRTLVLVDGRRLNPGDPTAPYADLNTIPAALVDRVEVVTGGASAVYGADAVAGVVNFIMKKNFQGFQVDAQMGANQDNSSNSGVDTLLKQGGYAVPGSQFDGAQYTASVIMGMNSPDGKGNITTYANYFHSDPVTQNKRDYSACGLETTYATTSSRYDTRLCAGSSNSQYGRFNAQANPASGVIPGTTARLYDNPNGSNTFVTTSPGSYNFNTTSYLQREDDRYNVGYFGHYEVNKMFDLYSDFMFTHDETTAQFAPSGFFAGTGPVLHVPTFQINCNNPFLSASQATALCGAAAGTSAITLAQIGYRFAAVPRTGDFTHQDFKINLGTRGDLGQGWSYDLNLQYGRATVDQIQGGYASLNALQNGLLVNPNGTCISGGSCVPVNIFQANSAGLSQAAYNYVIKPGFETGTTTEQIASFNINGDLGQYGIKSPFAQDGVGIALGTEYRRENLTFNTDAEESSGDLSGGSQVVGDSGTFDVYELFGEMHIPLVQNLPFIKAINFNPGYRFSDYSSIGTTNTYKLDLDYAVNNSVRFRYSYNLAVRAPNVNELYAPTVENLFGAIDPCAGRVIAPGTTAYNACIAQGATAAELSQAGGISPCPASQCSVLAGGNAALKPETAHTYTYGVVFTPSFVPRLSVSVDYYNIRIENLITDGLGGPNATLNSCEATANPVICGLIKRDPTTGELYGAGYVTSTNDNEGFLQTKGIDVTANYTYPIAGWGRLAFDMTGTYLENYVSEPYAGTAAYPGSGTYDCAGQYGTTCGTPQPHWKSKVRVTWTTPWAVTASVQWRYIGNAKLDGNTTNALTAYGFTTDTVSSEANTGSVNYFDLSLQWKIKDGYILRAGVNNVLDRQPPVSDSVNLGISALGNGNTFPQLYDTLGRNMYVGLTADF